MEKPTDVTREASATAPGPDLSEHDREFLLTNERASSGRASGTSLMWGAPSGTSAITAMAGCGRRNTGLRQIGLQGARWDIQRQHAHRLVDAADVVGQMSPIGGNAPIPTHERQVRPLCQLARPEDRAKAWAEAVETMVRVHAVATSMRSCTGCSMTVPSRDRTGHRGRGGEGGTPRKPAIGLLGIG